MTTLTINFWRVRG